MAREGWIKLHRKLLNHPVWTNKSATRILFWLMMKVDYQTGEIQTGRLKIASECGLKPSTTYRALKVLTKYNICNIKSNNKFSTIKLVNWHKYQGEGNSSGIDKVTTVSTKGNTIKKNKEKRIKNNNIYTTFFEKEFWPNYPPRKGKRLLKEKAKDWVVKNVLISEHSLLLAATKNYAVSSTAQEGFAKDAIRWLPTWREWLEPEKEQKGQIVLSLEEQEAERKQRQKEIEELARVK